MPAHTPEEVRDRAALYALGALDSDEARAFEAHLHAGCAACQADVDAFAAVARDLAHAAQPQAPPAALRARVLQRIADERAGARAAVMEQAGVRFVRSSQLSWQDGSAPAVEVKVLSVDEQRGYVTKLVRMAPGACLHPHRHADVEESYLLEGDLLVSGVLMHAGDYCRAEPGSVHTGVVTRGGCVFVAVCSQRDEVLTDV